VTVALPRLGGAEEATIRADLDEGGVSERHDVVEVTPPDVLDELGPDGLDVVSMGRPAAADPTLFLAAAASGALAVEER
jgi:hypothetical protein